MFKQGWAVDRIKDFENDIDTIKLDADLWGGAALSIDDILATYATVVGAHVEFDFGGGDILKVIGVSDINDLIDDILVF